MSRERVGDWWVEYIGVGPGVLWSATHEDFDGAPIHSESDDCPDKRCFTGPTREDVLQQVAEYEENEAITPGQQHIMDVADQHDGAES